MKKRILGGALLCLASASLVIGLGLFFFGENYVQFEYTTTVSYLTNFRNEQGDKLDEYTYYWYAISRNPSFEHATEKLENTFPDLIQTMDLNKYVYIVCQGYTLKKLSWNRFNIWGRFSPYAIYHGKVELGIDCQPNDINIYRIQKMNIDSDMHDRWSGYRIKIVR